jgi:hypothetical protein
MLQLEDLEFDYEPYPIGVARPVIADDLYREMVNDYLPMHTPGTGLKYVLSEKRRGKDYLDSIRSRPHWREFHRYIKSEEFIRYGLASLKNKYIGLDCPVAPRRVVLARTLAALFQGNSPQNVERLRTRFEFSALPADGGFVRPHTDTPKKRITLIVSMVGEGEWNPSHGGGTDMNRARVQLAQRECRLRRRRDPEDLRVRSEPVRPLHQDLQFRPLRASHAGPRKYCASAYTHDQPRNRAPRFPT